MANYTGEIVVPAEPAAEEPPLQEPPFFKEVTQLHQIPGLACYNIPEGYVYGTLEVTPEMFDMELMGNCIQLAHERVQFYKLKGIKTRVLNVRPFIPNTDNLADVKGKDGGTNANHTVVELLEGVVVKEGVPQSAPIRQTYRRPHILSQSPSYAHPRVRRKFGGSSIRIGRWCVHTR